MGRIPLITDPSHTRLSDFGAPIVALPRRGTLADVHSRNHQSDPTLRFGFQEKAWMAPLMNPGGFANEPKPPQKSDRWFLRYANVAGVGPDGARKMLSP